MLALRSLWLHKLRSILSVLGIIIGTASVIALMAFGRGSMEDALEDIRRQGTTNVIVSSVKPVDAPASATPEVDRQLRPDLGRFRALQADRHGDRTGADAHHSPGSPAHRPKVSARVVATTEAYAKINHFEMAAGRFLRDGEDQADEGDAPAPAQRGRARFRRGQGVIPLRGSPRARPSSSTSPSTSSSGSSRTACPEEVRVEQSRKRTTTWTSICRSAPAGSASANASCFDRAPAS